MNKWVFGTIIAVGFLVVVFFAVNFVRHTGQRAQEEELLPPAGVGFTEPPGRAKETSAFITANPLDLTQINALSKFRSCAGHNYSGLNVEGEEETYRSMKHYIEPTSQFEKTSEQVKIFAPFSGTVTEFSPEQRGSFVSLSPTGQRGGWQFIYFHVDLLPQFAKTGARITAGEHIGSGNLVGGENFDMATKHFGRGGQIFASPFHHMTDTVLAEYAAAGIATDKIIVSKAQRDAAPCQLAPGQSGRDANFVGGQNSADWVELR